MSRALIRQPWLSPMIAVRYAASVIQSLARGAAVRHSSTKNSSPKRTKVTTRQQLDKYVAAMNTNNTNALNGYADWCATRIEAYQRMRLCRRRYRYRMFGVYQLATLQIQNMWRHCLQKRELFHRFASVMRYMKSHCSETLRDAAATIIQDRWRRYTNARIYQYYRHLIRFRLVGDPRALLRAINPAEARLLEKATSTHVRFRLGGSTFPPTLFYKVFIHGPLCDVGAFAPRDYSEYRPITTCSTLHAEYRSIRINEIRVGASYFGVKYDTGPSGTNNWYRRYENNDWRPITAQTLADEFQVPPTGLFVKRRRRCSDHFHYSRLVRAQDRAKQAKERKLRWLKTMYKIGLAKERCYGETRASKFVEAPKPADESEYQPPCFDIELKDDIDELLTWTRDLDYDAYLRNWASLATSGPAASHSL